MEENAPTTTATSQQNYNLSQKIHFFASRYVTKKTAGVVIALLIAINIPVALYLSQQRQNVKQHASTNGSITIIDATTGLSITESTTPDVKLQILLPDNWEPQTPQSNRLQFIPQAQAQTTTTAPEPTLTPSPTETPPPPTPTATETPSPQPSATPTVTPTPTPVILCQDGSDDQVYSSSMAGCNGAVAYSQAESLCKTGISHLCSLDEYLANGGRTTSPNSGLRWLETGANTIQSSCPGFSGEMLTRDTTSTLRAFVSCPGLNAVDACTNTGYFCHYNASTNFGALCCSGTPPNTTSTPQPTLTTTPSISAPPQKHFLSSIIISNAENGDSGEPKTLTGQELIAALANLVSWRLNSLLPNETSATRKVNIRFIDTNNQSVDTTSEVTLKNPNQPTATTAPTTPAATLTPSQTVTPLPTGIDSIVISITVLGPTGLTGTQTQYENGTVTLSGNNLPTPLTATTDNTGSHRFNNLVNGQYAADFVVPNGYTYLFSNVNSSSNKPVTTGSTLNSQVAFYITPSGETAGPTTTPTGTIIPTMTLIPTVTIPPGNTGFTIKVGLQGIGKGGNEAPTKPQRTFIVNLFDNAGIAVSTKSGMLAFNTATNIFEGQIDMGTPAPGSYTVKAKTDKYLTKILSNILTISQTTKSYSFPAIPTLTAGDLNNDNLLNVQDYNIYKNCLGKNTAECVASSDLNDDGKTDTLVPTPVFLDYRMLITNFSIQKGD